MTQREMLRTLSTETLLGLLAEKLNGYAQSTADPDMAMEMRMDAEAIATKLGMLHAERATSNCHMSSDDTWKVDRTTQIRSQRT